MDAFLTTVCILLASVLQEAQNLDGVWVSDGYGVVAVVRGDSYRTYEKTPLGVVPSLVGRRTRSKAGSSTYILDTEAGPWGFELIPVEDGSLLFRGDGSASDIVLRRQPNGAKVLERRAPNDPIANFDVFWHGFRDHYPFFELRGVDWNESRRAHLTRVSLDTTDDDLFGILIDMIEPLQDTHTFVATPGFERISGGSKPDPEPLSPEDKKRASEIVAGQCSTKLLTLCEGRLQFARLRDNIGYLKLSSFEGYVPNRNYREGEQSLSDGLDQVFEHLAGINGLVIDIRLNPGGFALYGIQIASRLTTERYLAYAKCARNDPHDPSAMTDLHSVWVEPSERRGYHGPVALLTSRYSVSGAETFAMALMGREPAITRIGEETRGVFSDILLRHLPNGLLYALPNEVYLSEGGKSYAAVGVPPHIPIQTFARADLEDGNDPVLSRAIETLSD